MTEERGRFHRRRNRFQLAISGWFRNRRYCCQTVRNKWKQSKDTSASKTDFKSIKKDRDYILNKAGYGFGLLASRSSTQSFPLAMPALSASRSRRKEWSTRNRSALFLPSSFQ